MRNGPLHHRLFAWFGAAILMTGLVSAVIFMILAKVTETDWKRDYQRAQTFAAHLFARVWDDPAERTELARTVANDLDVGVVLLERGRMIAAHGPECGDRRWRVPIHQEGVEVGTVELCAHRHTGGPLKFLVPLLVLGVMLWGASIKLARRLSRPLREVARVAREIGDGNLEARPHVGHHPPQEVRTLLRAIEDMTARIKRQLDDQRVLLAAVSHELRTPLGHLRILSELARDGGADKLPKILDDIDHEVQEIDELVAQLLANARLDFSSVEPRPFDPADAARRALARKGLGEEKLVIEPTGNGSGDPTLIARALANLIDNAERHGRGLLRLRIRAEGRRIAFEVEDGGPGIPEAEKEQLFELFRSGTREHGNLGLGLALVRRIAEAHGGRAWAENRPEGGARIGFSV